MVEEGEAKTITCVYQRLRMALFHVTELEDSKLSGEIELEELYFGSVRKGKEGSWQTVKVLHLAC